MAMKTCKNCGKKYSGSKCPHCKKYRALAFALALLLTFAAPVVAPVAAGEVGWCEDCD